MVSCRKITLWLTVPIVVILSSRLFVGTLNHLIGNSITLPPDLFCCTDPGSGTEFFGNVYKFGVAAAATIAVALVCVVLAITMVCHLLEWERLVLRILMSVIAPIVISIGVAIWFIFGDFYPSIAKNLLQITLYAALDGKTGARIRALADLGICSGLIAFVFVSNVFATLLVRVSRTTEEQFLRTFTFTLVLASLPLLGTTTTLNLFYSMGATVLASTPGMQEKYVHVSQGLTIYWAVTTSSTLAMTAIFVFIATGIRLGLLAKWLSQPTFHGVLFRGVAILAPLLPPILDAMIIGLFKG